MRPLFLRGKDFSQVQYMTPVVRLQSWVKRKLTWDEQTLLLASIYELNQIDSAYPYARMMEATLFKSWFFPMKVKLTEQRRERIIASRTSVIHSLQTKPIRLNLILKAIALIARCPDDDTRIYWAEVERHFRKIQTESEYLL